MGIFEILYNFSKGPKRKHNATKKLVYLTLVSY